MGAPTGAAAPIAAGDLLLVIQMQDATVDAGNTASYGDGAGGLDQAGVTDYRNAGAYEYLAALGAVGSAGGVGCTAGQVPVRGLGSGAGLRNAYRAAARSGSTGRGTFQVVRVPQYRNATLAGDVVAAHWNGSTGGVLAIDVTGTLNANGFRLDASGRGFRGGGGRALSGATGLADTDRRTPAATAANGSKGEGIAGTPRFTFDQATFNAADRTAGANVDNTDEGYNNGSQARGAPGNAGGGGTDGNPTANDQNSGGGGGNGGAGGRGGNAWNSQDVSGGIGVAAFGAGNGGFTAAVARIAAGGGGGAGTRNNSAAVQSAGGAGGGIILVQARLFSGTGTIASDGAQGPAPDNDGGGGGGAGGTIVLRDNLASPFTTLAGYTVRANGAAGSDAWSTQAAGGTPGERHGPGGGGGGGVIWRNTRNAPTELTAGGLAGVTTTAADTFGALPGSGGLAAAFSVRTPGIFPGFECATVPVTLSYFTARAEAGGLTLRFATATETRNVGFRVLAGPAATRRPLGAFVAGAGDAAEPREYLHRVPHADGPLWLADVDVRGQETVHGPFEPGRVYGQPPDLRSAVDWAAARAALLQGARNARRGQAPEGAVLWVDTPGLQRITHEMLLAAGIDLGGVPARELSLSALGQPQQRAVEGGPLFGPGSAIIFHGEPARSLYSDAMPYLLARDARAVREVPVDDLPAGTPRAAWAMAQAHWAPQRAYAFSAPGPDPWYAARLLALAGQPAGIDVGLPVDAVARVPGATARLAVSMFGGSDWPDQGADHQVDLRLDGAPVARLSADGLVAFGFDGPLPALPADGTRNLRIEATGATGFDFDVVNIESATLEYPRLPRAVDGRWSAGVVRSEPPADNGTPDPLPAPGAGGDLLFGSGFESAATGAASFMLRGLPDGNVVAWRQVGTEWRALADVRTALVADGHAAWIPLDPTSRGVPYVAGSRSALLRPRIAPLHAAAPLDESPADWIAIAPAAFHAALEPLAAARRAQGLRTAIVDVADVFRRHGNMLPTGGAVQSFVREAVSRRGTRHVLLAGGNTYDYNDYLGIGAPSFVPHPLRADRRGDALRAGRRPDRRRRWRRGAGRGGGAVARAHRRRTGRRGRPRAGMGIRRRSRSAGGGRRHRGRGFVPQHRRRPRRRAAGRLERGARLRR